MSKSTQSPYERGVPFGGNDTLHDLDDKDIPAQAASRWQDDPKLMDIFWDSIRQVHQRRGLSTQSIQYDLNVFLADIGETLVNYSGEGRGLVAHYGQWLDKQASRHKERAADRDMPLGKDEVRQKYTASLKGGKPYLQVAGRVLLFRLDHPVESGWGIVTDLIRFDERGALVKAMIVSPTGSVIATDYAEALIADSKNYGGRVVEKATTAAVGRALALAGYGTDDIED